ncbi:MAG: DUF3570 domain-containing protein [Gammaproteobacteria bacterium]|nr:DUF3570 domain-containing protein [Pseudomonadales bacterium]MCP5348587.1 DUF3570 domain-containing protein [Pseudomonadales bacterium]
MSKSNDNFSTSTDSAQQSENARAASHALQALTSVALLIPGMIPPGALGAELISSGINVQYSQYQEGQRDLINVKSGREALNVEVLHLDGRVELPAGRFITYSYTQDTWSGATPVATAPLAADVNRPILQNTSSGVITTGASPFLNTELFLDRNRNPLQGSSLTVDPRNVLVLSSASPESRDQLEATVGQEWRNNRISVGFGVSIENDYESLYGNIGSQLSFNDNLTTVSTSLGYSTNRTEAILDPDILPYLTRSAYADDIARRGDSEVLTGNMHRWSLGAGLTQVIDQQSLVDFRLSLAANSGFLENPYKAVSVLFVDPAVHPANALDPVPASLRALSEQRPDNRDQLGLSIRYIHYFEVPEAALHVTIETSHDSWDVNTSSLELEWAQSIAFDWLLSPRVRYYTQSKAGFYENYLVSEQAFRKTATNAQGQQVWVDTVNEQVRYFRDNLGNFYNSAGELIDQFELDLRPLIQQFNPTLLPRHFSSDHRLSSFGSLSAGITVSRSWKNGLSFEAGLEYYDRAADLGSGGGPNSQFADFDFISFNAALGLDFGIANSRRLVGSMNNTAGMAHMDHANSDHRSRVPAGIRFSHRLHEAGQWMVGYRTQFVRQAGDLLSGDSSASDPEVVLNGCRGTDGCRSVPTYMNMKMHMLDIMYAPTDWLTLSIMPQFVDMDMELRDLEGRPPPRLEAHEHIGESGHTTGGLGDTLVVGLVGLYDSPQHHLQAGIGVRIPTGQVDLELRRTFRADGGLFHFGMQLGSGTFDLVPSLTYSGESGQWHWGAQWQADYRLESENESGYRLGNGWQLAGWNGFDLTPWLSATLRTSYRSLQPIQGDFDRYNARIGPMDFPYNQGGDYWDIGMGLNIAFSRGWLQGNQLGLEWSRPIHEELNGFQRETEDRLALNWQFHF